MAQVYGDKDEARARNDLFGARAGGARAAAPDLPEIAPGLFARLVEATGGGPTTPCRVAGAASFSAMRFRRGLVFEGVEFAGDFGAEVATFAGLRFTDCAFRGSLRLADCRVRGTLSVIRCRFSQNDEPIAGLSIWLGGTRIGGGVEIEDSDLAGLCSLAGAVVAGDFSVEGLRIAAPLDAVSLSLDNARIAGAISLGPVADAGGGARDRRSRLPGRFSAFGATCHSFMMKETDLGGECSFSGLQVATSLNLIDNGFGGDVRLDHIDCGEVVLVEGCTVRGRLSCDGTTVLAQLNIACGDYGEIHINGAAIGSFWVGVKGAVACTSIYATNCAFASYVKMSRLTVGVVGRGAAAAGAQPVSLRAGTIEFEHCRFGSLVTTWPVERDGVIDGWQPDNFVAVERAFLFTDCDVGGQLNLTRLVVSGRAAADAGAVRLDRTRLRGALIISSPLSIARRVEYPDEARDKARAVVAAGAANGYRARMRYLSMREFTASAVDLSGLELVRCGVDDADQGVDGCLVGDRMEIAGRLATYVAEKLPPAQGGRRRAHARIGGAIRLRGARIGELDLDSDSFRQRHGCSAWTSGVVLELADIGLLRVPRMEEGRAPDHNGFPVPLDLSGVTVRNWSFGEDVDDEIQTSADDYLDLLDNDETLHREVYKSVALSLRNAGRDRDAEKILYVEEYRARWETRQARTGLFRPAGSAHGDQQRWPALDWKRRPRGRRRRLAWLTPFRRFFRAAFGWAWEWFDRVLLRYRRNPIGLFYLILGLFFSSVILVAGHPANFELSDQSRMILQLERGRPSGLAAGLDYNLAGRNAGPSRLHWGLGDRFWIAARYHLPIVPLFAEDEFVASNENPLTIGVRGFVYRWNWCSAEAWFSFMSLLNWVMWPLLLTSLLRRALRSD